MILIVDNYDSFVYNIAQYVGELGHDYTVVRNTDITPAEIRTIRPDSLILSPGPGRPAEAGHSLDIVRELHREIPILGVCLGMQTICEAFGGEIVRAAHPRHGKNSLVYHDGATVFRGLTDPFRAGRYHSLIARRSTLPEELSISAWTDDGDIMGVRHTEHRVEGVQFHPESVLTEGGMNLLANFLSADSNRVTRTTSAEAKSHHE